MKSKWKLMFGPLNDESTVVEAVAYGRTLFEALGQLDKVFCDQITDECSTIVMMGPDDLSELWEIADEKGGELRVFQMGESESAYLLKCEYGDFDVVPSGKLTSQ